MSRLLPPETREEAGGGKNATVSQIQQMQELLAKNPRRDTDKIKYFTKVHMVKLKPN